MYTMVLSITHRISGVFLSLGLLPLVAWLVAAASGERAYARTLEFLSQPPMLLLGAVWVAAFWYHFFAGLRHLAWDVGYGFDKSVARRSGLAVVMLTVLAAAVTLALAWRRLGGAP